MRKSALNKAFQKTAQPVNYIAEATRVLQGCGITPKARKSFLASLSKQLTSQTPEERQKFLNSLSPAEIEAWINAFELISKFLAEALENSSSEEESEDVAANEQIQQLINISKSPEKSFSNRVSSFVNQKSPTIQKAPTIQKSTTTQKSPTVLKSSNNHKSPISSRGEVTLGNIYALSSSSEKEEKSDDSSIINSIINSDESDNKYNFDDRVNARVQTPPKPPKPTKKSQKTATTTSTKITKSQTSQQASDSKPIESSPKFFNFDQYPDHDERSTQTRGEAKTQTPPQSPHSPREIPSFVNLKVSSSSEENHDNYRKDPRTGLITIGADNFRNKNRKPSPPPSNLRLSPHLERKLSPSQQRQMTKQLQPKEQPPKKKVITKRSKKIIKKKRKNTIKNTVDSNNVNTISTATSASSTTRNKVNNNNYISPIRNPSNRARNVSPLSPEDKPASNFWMNQPTSHKRRAESPPSPRLLELSKPRSPKLPPKDYESDDFIVDEVFAIEDE
ncbi:hypothetical protein TRFO_22796 [Tritrichomonas foetus]|uniref:Uncharacterized protein n=1 Tax=Tritrichomonas foetus TaxID=1144522 RepID=A0A1J4KCA5_9EUKA|nr:hypothetical protein TRFO_22796 [Tritrichomonas foetus]|eukprot:OHT08610.1 hypothetical protein TRFO_22796 [Tritrichomonas foetus]